MKKMISKMLLLIFIGLTTVSCGQNPTKNTKNTKKVHIENVVEVITPAQFEQNSKGKTIVDVRTPREFISGHLKNAINIDFYDKNHLEAFTKFNKTEPLYLYCRSGRRSNILANELKKIGFKKVYDLKGGFIAWENNRFEIER